MSKFRLSRKAKKQYKKDNIVFNAHWSFKRKANWEWFYHKQRVIDRYKHIYLNP